MVAEDAGAGRCGAARRAKQIIRGRKRGTTPVRRGTERRSWTRAVGAAPANRSPLGENGEKWRMGTAGPEDRERGVDARFPMLPRACSACSNETLIGISLTLAVVAAAATQTAWHKEKFEDALGERVFEFSPLCVVDGM